MHMSFALAANVGPKAQKELFHEHDRLLFAKGRSEFVYLDKNSGQFFQKFISCAFSAPARQVTQHYK